MGCERDHGITKKTRKSGHEINLAAGSEEIAESLNKCVKNLATAAEALQKLGNDTGNQISERLAMVKGPTQLEENRKLFGFKHPSHITSSVSSPSSVKRFKHGGGKVFIPICNTWTHKFFLCGSSMCSQVPTTREKIEHRLAGLGERDIVFHKDANAEHVQKKLIESYPVLKECGGYEMMRSVVGSCKSLEVLLVPPGGYKVHYLKSCLLQSKGYIRPIQKQLSLEPLSENDDRFAVSMTSIVIVHIKMGIRKTDKIVKYKIISSLLIFAGLNKNLYRMISII